MMTKVVSNYLDQARSLSNSTILPLVDLGLMTPAITMEENVQFRVRVFEQKFDQTNWKHIIQQR